MPRRLVPLAGPLAVLTVLVVLTGCSDDPEPTGADPVASDAPGVPDDPDDRTDATDAVVAEVSSVAPELESAVRGTTYPRSVEEAVASLADAGIDLTPGIEVGGYVYDPEAVEFTLCLQDADGAWASYDTAPMGVRDSGSSGSCPTD